MKLEEYMLLSRRDRQFLRKAVNDLVGDGGGSITGAPPAREKFL